MCDRLRNRHTREKQGCVQQHHTGCDVLTQSNPSRAARQLHAHHQTIPPSLPACPQTTHIMMHHHLRCVTHGCPWRDGLDLLLAHHSVLHLRTPTNKQTNMQTATTHHLSELCATIADIPHVLALHCHTAAATFTDFPPTTPNPSAQHTRRHTLTVRASILCVSSSKALLSRRNRYASRAPG